MRVMASSAMETLSAVDVTNLRLDHAHASELHDITKNDRDPRNPANHHSACIHPFVYFGEMVLGACWPLRSGETDTKLGVEHRPPKAVHARPYARNNLAVVSFPVPGATSSPGVVTSAKMASPASNMPPENRAIPPKGSNRGCGLARPNQPVV